MPNAVLLYKLYCYAAALLNVGLLLVSLWFIVQHEALANEVVGAKVVLGAGIACAPLALAMVVVNVSLPRLPRNSSTWAVHLTNIVVGLGTCVLAPLALPTLLAWLKPETQDYYKGGGA